MATARDGERRNMMRARRLIAMGAMMGASMGAWVLLWIILGLAVVVAGGVVLARTLDAGRKPEPPQLPPAESTAVRDAKDALKLRYAHGEIDREEYLQGKVELED
jgi:putative membrane protein